MTNQDSQTPKSPKSLPETQLHQSPANSTAASSQSDQDWQSKVFWATLFIGGGLLLVAINLGYLPWPDWQYLWRLWPLLLIFMGLFIFLGKSRLGKWTMTILSLLLIFSSLGYAMLMADAQLYRSARDYAPWLPAAGQSSNSESDNGPLQSQQVIDNKSEYSQAASRVVNVDMGMGTIDIQPADMQRQIELYSRGNTDNSQTSSRVNVNNDKVIVDVDINKGFNLFQFGQDAQYVLDIGQPEQSTELNVNVGAGNANINLDQDFKLNGGTWEVGAGNLVAKLNQNALPSGSLKLDVGVGKMTLYVPANLGLQIKHDVGVGSLEVFGQKVENEGTFTSENYNQASQKVTLEAEVGVGNLIITQL